MASAVIFCVCAAWWKKPKALKLNQSLIHVLKLNGKLILAFSYPFYTVPAQ